MAESYSVQAVLSAKDSNFSSVFSKAADIASSFGKTLSGGLGFGVLAGIGQSAFSALTSGIQSATSAIADVGKQAISGYAQFEQLEGGVKKLFGEDMASTVMKNASNAFSTAGMNANQYMETVTGFSSSLIQSLGGDTEAAAAISDRAIRDMSDNANTFGTDMEAIQTAYQGFAKGNFTMLDNLKLGYGGTKEEMARLIQEASAMTDAQKELGVSVDANDMSFANIANAISVVQKNMGIMGTTANEASSTIEGSTNSMKAAWGNMLTGMADENADFESLASSFVDTLVSNGGKGGVLGTIIPRISQVVSGMANVISTTLPKLIQQVVPLIKQNIPIIISAVQQAIQTVLQVLPEIVSVIADLIPQIISSLMNLLPTLITAGVEVLLALVDGITQAIPQLIEQIPTIILKINEAITQAFPQIIEAGISLLLALVEGILNAIPQLVANIPTIISNLINALLKSIPQIINAGVQLLVSLVQNLPAIINGIVTALPQLITGIINGIMDNLPAIIDAGVQLFTALIQNLPLIIETLVTAIPQIIDGIANAFTQSAPQMREMGLDLIHGLWEGISNAASWLLDQLSGFASKIVSGIKGFFGISSPSRVMEDAVGKNLALGIEKGFGSEMSHVSSAMKKEGTNAVNSVAAGMNAGTSGAVQTVTSLNKGVTQVFTSNKNNYTAQGKLISVQLSSGINSGKPGVTNAAKGLANSAVNGLKSVSASARGAASSVAASYAKGIQGGGGSASSAGNSIATQAINAMAAGGHVSAAYNAGAQIGNGLARGIASQVSNVANQANQLVNQANRAIQAKAKIGSPSKVTTQFGKWYGEGFGNGIKGMFHYVWGVSEDLVTIPVMANIPSNSNVRNLNDDYAYGRGGTYTIEVPLNIDGREFAKATATYTEGALYSLNIRDERKLGYV